MVRLMDARQYTQSPELNVKLSLFLNALSECGNVNYACEQGQIKRYKLKTYLKDSPAFAEDYIEAEALGAASIEDEVRRRGVMGWDEPVYYKGSVVGHIRKHSDMMLAILVKGAMPDKYADRSKQQIANTHEEVPAMDPAVRDRRFVVLRALSKDRLDDMGDLA